MTLQLPHFSGVLHLRSILFQEVHDDYLAKKFDKMPLLQTREAQMEVPQFATDMFLPNRVYADTTSVANMRDVQNTRKIHIVYNNCSVFRSETFKTATPGRYIVSSLDHRCDWILCQRFIHGPVVGVPIACVKDYAGNTIFYMEGTFCSYQHALDHIRIHLDHLKDANYTLSEQYLRVLMYKQTGIDCFVPEQFEPQRIGQNIYFYPLKIEYRQKNHGLHQVKPIENKLYEIDTSSCSLSLSIDDHCIQDQEGCYWCRSQSLKPRNSTFEQVLTFIPLVIEQKLDTIYVEGYGRFCGTRCARSFWSVAKHLERFIEYSEVLKNFQWLCALKELFPHQLAKYNANSFTYAEEAQDFRLLAHNQGSLQQKEWENLFAFFFTRTTNTVLYPLRLKPSVTSLSIE